MATELIGTMNDGLEILQRLSEGDYEVGKFFTENGFKKVTIYSVAISKDEEAILIETTNEKVTAKDNQTVPGCSCTIKYANYEPIVTNWALVSNGIKMTYEEQRRLLDIEYANVLMNYNSIKWIHEENADQELLSSEPVVDTRGKLMVNIGHKLDI